MNDTTVRPFHVRTGKSEDPAHLLSGGVSQVHFICVLLLWLSMELASILSIISHLQSTLLLTQSCLILSCQCATSPKFVVINGFQFILSILFMEAISLQSCGYYFWSCGYGFILWIVDTILFRAERPHCVGTTLIQNALS